MAATCVLESFDIPRPLVPISCYLKCFRQWLVVLPLLLHLVFGSRSFEHVLNETCTYPNFLLLILSKRLNLNLSLLINGVSPEESSSLVLCWQQHIYAWHLALDGGNDILRLPHHQPTLIQIFLVFYYCQ